MIVCGIGKTNAAAATGYIAGLSAESAIQSWLNVGIAGGDVAQFGDAVVANAILDLETNQQYYPSLCFDHGLPEFRVATVNEPSDSYLPHTLYDMEASGFYNSASKFSTSELVHCCKVVSDNSGKRIDKIDKETTIKLIHNNLDRIDALVKNIMDIAHQLEADTRIDLAAKLLMERHHFTESQKNTLKLYLQNWFALNGESNIEEIELATSKNSRSYLESLKKLIDSASVSY